MPNIIDVDFKKESYQHTWEISARKEHYVAAVIEDNTGIQTEFIGTGAGSTKFIPTKNQSADYELGYPDVHLLGTNVYVEITGQLEPQWLERVRPLGLWFRPDKFDSVINHPDQERWFCHCIQVHSKSTPVYYWLRFILVDRKMLFNYYNHKFKSITIDTKQMKNEHFLEIPATYDGIVSQWEFIDKINRKVA